MYDVAESTEEGMISRINSGERWVGLDKHEWHVSIVQEPGPTTASPAEQLSRPSRDEQPGGTTAFSAGNLPCVPSRLRDRIVRGEFVDMEDLLPECIGAEEEDITRIAVDSGRSVQLVHKPSSTHVPCRRIHDVASWLEAFTTYTWVRVDLSPELTLPLLAYQATILEANFNYQTDAWLAYDRRFRRAVSVTPQRYQWQTIDPHLWQSCFTSRGRSACSRCSLIHPVPSPHCPFRGGLPLSQGRSGCQHSATHQGKPICRNFNRKYCNNPACPRAHVCSRCRGRHAEADCTKPASSSSSPPSQV